MRCLNPSVWSDYHSGTAKLISRRYRRWLGLKPGLSFQHLKVLWLEGEEIGEWFFHGFSSRFPCLEDLVLDKDIQICSNSLQCITLTYWMTPLLMTKFDVPKITKFKYTGCHPLPCTTLLDTEAYTVTSSLDAEASLKNRIRAVFQLRWGETESI
ncbi:hypothetical protein ACS0TY_014084 [Phlomoides rotata]